MVRLLECLRCGVKITARQYTIGYGYCESCYKIVIEPRISNVDEESRVIKETEIYKLVKD